MASDSFHPIEKVNRLASMTPKWTRCDFDHCGRPAIGSLELRYLCLDHFISDCYKRLDQCGGMPYGSLEDDFPAPSDRFLQECIEQSADWVRPVRGLDNLDRARLFDIFLWASEVAANRKISKPDNLGKMVRSDTGR